MQEYIVTFSARDRVAWHKRLYTKAALEAVRKMKKQSRPGDTEPKYKDSCNQKA